MADIELTVVRNGLRNLLPALSSFQPFPSEMFGGFARCFKLSKPAPLGDAGSFFTCMLRPLPGCALSGIAKRKKAPPPRATPFACR